MNHTQLKERLMSDARSRGICAEGYGLMRKYDRDELIAYYLANPDWCMGRGFPSLDILCDEFRDCQDKGVFIGKDFNNDVIREKQVYVFHSCRGIINVEMDYDNAVMPMLYFANHCRIIVKCLQKNTPPIIVPVYQTDEPGNEVVTVNSENCEFKRHTIKLLDA